jgi:hypothetical protein
VPREAHAGLPRTCLGSAPSSLRIMRNELGRREGGANLRTIPMPQLALLWPGIEAAKGVGRVGHPKRRSALGEELRSVAVDRYECSSLGAALKHVPMLWRRVGTPRVGYGSATPKGPGGLLAASKDLIPHCR